MPSLADDMRGVEEAARAGDMPRAAALAEQAIAQGAEHPRFLTLAAYRRLQAQDHERALAFAVRAHALAPGNADVLNAMGECLAKTGRPANAVLYFDKALALAPESAVLHFNAAAAHEQMSAIKRARDLYARAFALDPRRADAAARAAFLCANRGEMEMAREMGLKALALDPALAFAGFAVALADIDARRFEEARARMGEMIPHLPEVPQALAQSILGDALDGLGRAADAFGAYTRYGDAMRGAYAGTFGAAERGLARTRRIAAYVERAPAASWQAAPGASPAATHVFLVGFPRSGTTLLGQVLAAHPRISVLDEKPALMDAAALTETDAGLDRLAAMGEAELASYRGAYWKRVAEFGGAPDRQVFIDKMPLNCEVLCLIAKLFPAAKIVFSVRDPRDAVFSSFRRRFGMTRQMAELLTLDGTRAYYDATMRLCALYRERLALAFLDVRHEDLVRDIEGETRRLCGFLGVAYDDAVKDFAGLARHRDIATPSAAQVARGLYNSGMGQWRAYRGQLAPVLPALAPWVARLGYEES